MENKKSEKTSRKNSRFLNARKMERWGPPQRSALAQEQDSLHRPKPVKRLLVSHNQHTWERKAAQRGSKVKPSPQATQATPEHKA